MAVTEDEVIESWKRFFNRGTNWKDFPQVTSYEEYRRITDKQHLSKAKSMPIKFLKASGKGFFIDKDGYALGIRDEDMQIFVDADACPVVGIVEKVAKEHSIPVTLLCDTNHVLSSDYSEVIVVGAGADAVDYKLISICHRGDIVVSQDYGVAAMALGKGLTRSSGPWI